MDFEKKKPNYLITQNRFENITIFKDTSFKFLYQKVERISMAVYLITNLMSVDEPIKWQLRKTALNLLDSIMSLSNATLASRDNYLREINKRLFQLISLYQVAFRSGFISVMNYEVVYQELLKLSDFLVEYDQGDSKTRSNLFNQDFFQKDIVEPSKAQIEQDFNLKDNFNQSLKDNSFNRTRVSFIKDKIYKGQYKGQDVLKPKMSFTAITPDLSKSISRNDRRQKIINIIKQKGNVAIKDITDLIKDASEKTIQRELLAMVEDNVLLKEGERRWSRYMLRE